MKPDLCGGSWKNTEKNPPRVIVRRCLGWPRFLDLPFVCCRAIFLTPAASLSIFSWHWKKLNMTCSSELQISPSTTTGTSTHQENSMNLVGCRYWQCQIDGISLHHGLRLTSTTSSQQQDQNQHHKHQHHWHQPPDPSTRPSVCSWR